MYKKHTDSDQMYDYLKKIVKMFECEYCGECCRDNQVFLFQEDFKRISEKHPDIYDMLDKIARGEGQLSDLDHLKEVSSTMTATSKCEIGKTVPVPIMGMIESFEDQFLVLINIMVAQLNLR